MRTTPSPRPSRSPTRLSSRPEAALAEAQEQYDDARIRAQAADDVLGDVRGEMPALVERAVRGEAVALRDVVRVRHRVRSIEAWASFTGAVARRLGEAVEKARAELAEAKHQAWSPVLERAIEMRIAAARRADRARLAGMWGRGHTPHQVAELEAAKAAALAAAQPLFDAATEAIRIACQNGFRFPHNPHLSQPHWPTSEDRERAFWCRPMSAKEFADALR